METKKVRKNIFIAETFAIILAVIVLSGYVYWLVFGISPIDDRVKKFVDGNYLLSVVISLFIFGILFFSSYRNYKKRGKNEFINLVIYIVIALIFVIYFVSGFI